MKYILTPEFHRNLWLKFSPFRLAAAPVFVAICTAICLNLVPEKGVLFDRDYSYTILTHGAIWFYFIIVVIWGNYEAGTAMQEEIKGNTWDFQRMSSITALQLVAGKIFGATSYIWYIGLITLLPLYYGLSNMESPVMQSRDSLGLAATWDVNNDIYVLLYLLLAGLVGHALAFLASFIDLTSFIARTGRKRVPRGSGAFALGVVASWMAFSLAQSVSPKLADYNSLFMNFRMTKWYGVEYTSASFVTASMLFFCAWFLVGSYRLARAELMHGTMPVFWMGFVATFLGWAKGFANPNNAYYYLSLFGLFALSLLLCYAVMLFEASDTRKYARFYASFKRGDFRAAFENMHKWAATLPFVAICFVLVMQNMPHSGRYITSASMAAFMLATALFAVRDGLIIHAMIGARGSRNLGFKAAFYYLMVYLLLPVLHFALMPKSITQVNTLVWLRNFFGGLEAGEVPEMIRSLAMYYPLPVGEFSVSIGPVLLEAGLAGAYLWWSIDRARQRRAK